ncbi:hypothetical protein IE81DRAFT_162016 [Ceraceosorus guamensis]|uniref:Uncharacterized protein n=1 Tax=Ceraceosorus guamensis TaxID=1522189 RepID=A0A316WCH6_9BASI|nr:hypothetical protein IE81DRAFT_162016 [Ceraceosorus guamensis]PWN45573.1 hypothetical protein IE81DRAFT_162016 [Ceraceosorus guamensis]
MSFAPLLRRSASTVGTCVCNRHAAAAAAAAAGSSRSMTTATATAISNAVTLKCSPKLASSSACCSSRTFSSSTAHRTAAAADATITASFPPANSAEHTELLQRAKARLVHLGFHHQESFWEQRICWGDHDCVSIASAARQTRHEAHAAHARARARAHQFQHGELSSVTS